MTTGTITHYVKHTKNVKVVHIKETVITNWSHRTSHTKAIVKKMSLKYATDTQKKTHPGVCKSNRNPQVTIMNSLFCKSAPRNICLIPSKHSPTGTLWGNCFWSLLDTGLKITFTQKGNINEII